jgi:two-component system chemotaxis response regulator CheB
MGGVDTLREIVAALPPALPAAVLVVLHVGHHESLLPAMLQTAGPLPAHHAQDGEPLESGQIYVAPPDRHLVMMGDGVRTVKAPKENFARPAIDPLFRSAAVARGARVIGAILTGHLDDGTAGLAAIRACGGITIAQDPDDAFAPDMPRNAMRFTPPDYILCAKEIGPLLATLAGRLAPNPAPPPPTGLLAESEALLLFDSVEQMSTFAKPSALTCPECGGTLWQIDEATPPRYRCHTGHAFGPETLNAAVDHSVERTLWEAIRALREKIALAKQRAAYHTLVGETEAAQRRLSEARRTDEASRELEKLLCDKK